MDRTQQLISNLHVSSRLSSLGSPKVPLTHWSIGGRQSGDVEEGGVWWQKTKRLADPLVGLNL